MALGKPLGDVMGALSTIKSMVYGFCVVHVLAYIEVTEEAESELL